MIFTLSRASPMNSFSEEDFAKFPICVDLDGTLWAGDCLWLCARDFLKRHPFRFLQLFIWWKKGRTHLKHNLLKNVIFDPKKLVFFPEVFQYVQKLKEQGAKLYLVTGSDQEIADKVSSFLNIFDGAFGSTPDNNLVGEKKAALHNKMFGKKKYVYFGNEWKDRLVWQYSIAAGAVNVDKKTSAWLSHQPIYTRRFICKS